MKIVAYDTVTGKNFNAWTTEKEPDCALVVCVPGGYDIFTGEPRIVEVAIGRVTLLAAAQTGALERAK